MYNMTFNPRSSIMLSTESLLRSVHEGHIHNLKYSLPYVTDTKLSILGTFFPLAQQPLVDQVLLTTEASRSHSDTEHSVGHL